MIKQKNRLLTCIRADKLLNKLISERLKVGVALIRMFETLFVNFRL